MNGEKPIAGDSSGPLANMWQPAGGVYLVFVLAGLAVGLWPGAIYPSRIAPRPAPLAVLQCIAVAQVAFILLVHPLVLMGRVRKLKLSGRAYLVAAITESATLLFVTLPFYVVAVWLGDATAVSPIRSAIAVACLWPLAWSAGWWLAKFPSSRPAVLIGLLIAALGLPAACYISLEFIPASGIGQWLWRVSPAMFAWQNAASTVMNILPAPALAVLFWPAAAIVMMFTGWFFCGDSA